MTSRRDRVVQWLLWFSVLAIATIGLFLLRSRLDKAHFALVFLLVVLGGSAAGGRVLGVTLAAVAFLIFDIGFLPPYNTIAVSNPFDWIVLVVFLITGVIAAELLERRRKQAEIAEALGLERVRLASAENESEALRRADRLKDALLAAVSHDLRTPLTTIKGIANEIARGGDSSQAYVIEEEADRLTSLVDDLLDLSQIAAGEMKVDTEVNTADDVIGGALQRVESAYPERKIETTLEGAWTDLVGRFDYVHTMRILTNLLDNAAKYAPASTPITLRAWRKGDELRFSVEDQGSAIPEVFRERIFEPFFRGEDRPEGTRGTGLGLSTSRKLAELQGGRLWYETKADGTGRFVLSLPGADVPTVEPRPKSL
jgi:two-component system sensor histidine kinase KdpD